MGRQRKIRASKAPAIATDAGALGPEWMGDNRKVLAVARVSARKQVGNYSPAVQRKGIQEYTAKVGLELADVVDLQESASDHKNRRKFNAVLKRAKDENIRHIAFWVWDRTTRNMTDHEVLESEILSDEFVLHVANDSRVLHAKSPDSDWMTAEFSTVASKQYVRQLKRRVNESMKAKAERGWYPTRAPIGYINKKAVGPDGRPRDRGGTIEVTDWGRRLLRRMGELRIEGLSFHAVGTQVLDEGLVPTKHRWGFTGKKRAATRVEDILKNPFYRGQFILQGVLYDGKHEPIFTEAEWSRIQDIARRGSQRCRKNEGLFTTADFRLHCADPKCECLITYAPIIKKKSGKRYDYYHCANGKSRHQREVNITEDSILAQLGGAVDAIQITEDLAEAISKLLNETHHRAQRAKDREAYDYQQALEDLRERENRLYDRMDGGEIDSEEYKQQRVRFRQKQDDLFGKLQEAQRQIDGAYLVVADQVLNLAKNARTLWETRSREERRDFLAKLLLNPVVEGVTVRYDLKEPFAVLSEMREKESWRARRDSNPRPSA